MSGGVLVDLLRLDPVGEDRFLAREAPESGGTLFGGQLLAQSLMAAVRTTAPDRVAHSLHAYFLRAGDVGENTFLLRKVSRHVRHSVGLDPPGRPDPFASLEEFISKSSKGLLQSDGQR